LSLLQLQTLTLTTHLLALTLFQPSSLSLSTLNHPHTATTHAPNTLLQAEVDELRAALDEREGQLLGQVENEAALKRQVGGGGGGDQPSAVHLISIC